MSSASPATAESSSSSTLWATASQEWVIKPKPKPGRKPKTDLTAPPSETDQSCRKIQNRAAQRAFRERKQSQLAELQARLQSYEQGEIERNVAIQKIAKRLKDENELLRQENATLKARIVELEGKAENVVQDEFAHPTVLLGVDKKRGRDMTPPIDPQAKKKTRNDSTVDYLSTSLVSVTDGFTPLPFSRQNDLDSNGFTMSTPTSNTKTVDPIPSLPFACGLCESNTACVCREITTQSMEHSMVTGFHMHDREGNSAVSGLPTKETDSRDSSSKSNAPSSIRDGLPAYEPPVPLRRRNKGAAVNSIFPVQEVPQYRAICSGDPNNCFACAGDSFGQTFCAAIGNSSNCDCSAETISRCCGVSSSGLDCPSTNGGPNQLEMMPTNDAWQRLKAHPNVQFADLTLLANVVASRSRCNGPHLVISAREPTLDPDAKDGEIRQLEDSPPPTLVPQEVLLECGRRRMRQVHAAGVRDALRLLDMKYP